MEYRYIGSSDLKVSEVGFGAWQAGRIGWGTDYTDSEVKEALSFALDSGVNFIDTAEMYGKGHSESVVGEVLRNYDRSKVIIATKVNPPHLGKKDLISSAHNSIERMKCSYIDLYQIHWPDFNVPIKETADALESLVSDGLVRYIGTCNFPLPQLKELVHTLDRNSVVSNQMRYNILQREVEEELVPYMKSENIGMIAWSPIAKGLLTGKYNEDNIPGDDVRKRDRLFTREIITRIAPLMEALKRIAGSHEKTVTQVSLNYLLTKGALVIPGIKRKEQMAENIGASGFTLTGPEIKEIDSLSEIS
ncbi:MAG: aldo/keto reductase [Candidatus Thermoplasmatota archaeon]|nr:aldo/keto reductase [Candidatus Thermoplasmatota archaeon]